MSASGLRVLGVAYRGVAPQETAFRHEVRRNATSRYWDFLPSVQKARVIVSAGDQTPTPVFKLIELFLPRRGSRKVARHFSAGWALKGK